MKNKVNIGNWVDECLEEALTSNTPGAEVETKYPRQVIYEIENFDINIKKEK